MEKYWKKAEQKAEKHSKKFKVNFNNTKITPLKNLIEKTKNEYLKNLKSIATRKTSEMFWILHPNYQI